MMIPGDEEEDKKIEAKEVELEEMKASSVVVQSVVFARKTICRSIVRNPIKCCLGNWIIAFILTFAVISGGYFEFSQFGLNDFVVIDEQDVQNFLAVISAEDLANAESELEDQQISFREDDLFTIAVSFLFAPHGNAEFFSSENVQEMCQVESLVINQPNYPFFCVTDDNQGIDTICKKQEFIISSIFYPDDPEFNCIKKTDEEVKAIFDDFVANSPLASFFLDDLQNPTLCRSVIFMGGPLGDDSPPFKNFSVSAEETVDPDDNQIDDGYLTLIAQYQESLFSFFGVENKIFTPAFARTHFRRSGSNLEVRTGGALLESAHFLDVISVDQIISGGAFLIVLIMISIYMKTVLFGLISMVAVLLSIPLGLFLMAIVLQINYFTPMNILVLFLIAGIGADNVLVLFDAWKQSEDEIDPDSSEEYESFLFRRLDYTYGRAVSSVMHTASTTFIAFIATSVTPIDAVGGLGLYAALVVLVNLIYMFCIHPSNLLFYHRVFLRSKEKKIHDAILLESKAEKNEKEEKESEIGRKSDEEMSSLDKLFEKYIFVINKTWCPFVAVPLALILGVIMLSFTSKLQTPSQLESNFKDGHMFKDFASDFNDLFIQGTAESFTKVDGVFGIADLDIEGIPKFSGDAVQGVALFDDNFEIFSKQSQDFIIDICNELETLTCNEDGCTEPTLVKSGTVECTMQEFRTFVEESRNTSSFVDESIGIATEEDFILIMEEFLSGVGFGIREKVGIIDGEIKFLSIEYRMTMQKDQPLVIKEDVLKVFDAYTEDVRSRAPDQLKSFFQSSFDHVWQHTEQAFVTGLFSGISISLGTSFLVLLIGTNNVVVSFLAIIGVGSVVMSVLGTIQTMGWELGTAESVAGVFVIGLAVDYIVHLGHMFMHSRNYLRGFQNPKDESEYSNAITRFLLYSGENVYYNDEMIAFSVRKMGPTVLAGATTTFFSALVLSLCTFAFFAKMSILLMLTIFYAALYAFAFFVPSLRVFGPGQRRIPLSHYFSRNK